MSLEDLGSTNGTKINGLTPMGAATLYDGDEIAFGGYQAPVCGRAISGIFCRIIRERRRAAPSIAMRNLQQLAQDEAAAFGIIIYGWPFMPS